jgi:hypothetical protein
MSRYFPKAFTGIFEEAVLFTFSSSLSMSSMMLLFVYDDIFAVFTSRTPFPLRMLLMLETDEKLLTALPFSKTG